MLPANGPEDGLMTVMQIARKHGLRYHDVVRAAREMALLPDGETKARNSRADRVPTFGRPKAKAIAEYAKEMPRRKKGEHRKKALAVALGSLSLALAGCCSDGACRLEFSHYKMCPAVAQVMVDRPYLPPSGAPTHLESIPTTEAIRDAEAEAKAKALKGPGVEQVAPKWVPLPNRRREPEPEAIESRPEPVSPPAPTPPDDEPRPVAVPELLQPKEARR